MDNNDIENIQNTISYTFKNTDLLQQAFIRRSYSEENGGENNEVLEWIGDKVLDLVVTKFLAQKYGFITDDEEYKEYSSDKSERELTEERKQFTSNANLAQCVYDLDLSERFILGKGDKKNRVWEQDSVNADLFEAILGAVAIDSNWDMVVLQSVVENMLNLHNGQGPQYYTNIVNNWCSEHCKKLPTIQSIGNSVYIGMPLLPFQHQYDPHYLFSRLYIGHGNTQIEQVEDACKQIYNAIISQGLSTFSNLIENPSKNEAINQLETLARRGYFSIPQYQFEEYHDEDGNPRWSCTCNIMEFSKCFNTEASSKKEAKKSAAYEMLKYVLSL